MRYELTDYEWVTIKPFLPNKPRGVPRRWLHPVVMLEKPPRVHLAVTSPAARSGG
jgi:hypothetical protein